MEINWLSFFIGVLAVFAVCGLTIFGVAFTIAVKKMKSAESVQGSKNK